VLLREFIRPILGCMLFAVASVHAESLMEFQVDRGKRSAMQPVMIKDGTVLVKSAGGDGNLDILYEQANERLILIDHKKQRFTPVTDEKVSRIARQAEDVQPLLQGFSEQLRKLSPKQRAKWESMLGGISLDQFDSARRAAESTKLMKTGVGKKVAGISCEQMNVVKGSAKAAEFCLADPAALKLPKDDSATIRSLIEFTQRLAAHAQGLSTQFGIELPASGIASLAGIPVEMRDFSGKHPVVMTLSRVGGGAVPSDSLKVPAGYRPKELALW
jgi:hypothetical protein